MRYRRKPEEVTAELWDGFDPEFHPELERLGRRTPGSLLLLPSEGGASLHIQPGDYLVTRPDGSKFALDSSQFFADYERVAE